MKKIELIKPDDWHVHFREGSMIRKLVPETSKLFNRAIVMPNLKSPIINSKQALKYKKKIITDIDLIYLTKKNLKTIVVTGTNGKSTTCKMIYCMLKKNNHKVVLGGNIGTPVLNLNIKKKDLIILPGGNDILGKNYLFKTRLKIEKDLLNLSIRKKIPLLGVCRGMQVINNYFGGDTKKIKVQREAETFKTKRFEICYIWKRIPIKRN